MPNYRKWNNNANRNKNKNKNKNQSQTTTSSSSSVKQEIRVVETVAVVGTEPNLPADVSKNLCTTSAKKSVFEKNVVVVCVDESSSPSNNEEIDENACTVDTDTCDSGDTQTLERKSNCSSTFYCSSSSSSSKKSSTEIERHRSERSVLDGDSTLGNSVITDTFVETNSGKNSLKTGSANTKDATEPVAEKTATESTRIDDINFGENNSRLEDRRDESKERSRSTESAREVNEGENHKVIVHTVVVKNGSESSMKRSEEVITQQTPAGHSEKVILHQISRDDPYSSKVIVHEEEESRSTSHTAFKKEVDLSTKLSTKTAGSSTTPTLSFSNVQGQHSRQFDHPIFSDNVPFTQQTSSSNATGSSFSRVQGHPGSEIVHRISKESSDRVIQESSKVIVHQISKEDQIGSSAHPVIEHQISKEDQVGLSTRPLIGHQISKEEHVRSSKGPVIVHQISNERKVTASKGPVIVRHISNNREQVESSTGSVIDHQISREGQIGSRTDPVILQQSLPQKSEHKVIIHQVSSSNDTKTSISPLNTPVRDQPSSPQQSRVERNEEPKKVIIIPILQENSTQTSPLPSFSESPLHSNLLELIKDDQSQANSLTNDREISRQTSSSPLSRSPVICFANLSETLEGKVKPASVSRDEVDSKSSKEIVHPILHEGATQTSPTEPSPDPRKFSSSRSPERKERLKPLVIPTFPVTRHSKVIIHPIAHPVLAKPAFPSFSTKSMEELDQSSKKIATKILQDVASELKSSFLIEKTNEKKVYQEPVVTSFPISMKTQNSLRPGFFENQKHQMETNPVDAQEKVIFHHISNENSTEFKPYFEDQSSISFESREKTRTETFTDQQSSSKVIQHQISKNDHGTTQEKSDSTYKHPSENVEGSSSKTDSSEPKVIVHQISKENNNSASSGSFPLTKDLPPSSSPESKKTRSAHFSFPSKLSSTFPTSVEKIDHPTQYNSNSKVLEHKEINIQKLREESKSRLSYTALTSPFSFPTQSDNKSKVEKQPTSSSFPVVSSSKKASFFLSNQKPNEIRHQISTEKPGPTEFVTSSKTTSKYESSSTESKETIHKIVKEVSSSGNDLPKHSHDQQTVKSSSPETSKSSSSYESNENQNQHTSTQHDVQAKTSDLQLLRDSSTLQQTISSNNSSSSEPKEIIHPIRQECDATSSDHHTQPTSSDHHTQPIPCDHQTQAAQSDIQTQPTPGDHETQVTPNDQKQYDHQTSQDESISSSEGSVMTAIQTESPRSISPSAVDDQKDKVPSEERKTQSRSPSLEKDTSDTEKLALITSIKQGSQSEKVIYHPIVRQMVVDKPLGYRVESPQPESRPIIAKKSKSFDDDDVVIQEMSDTSSAGDTDNPPVISEAESETDTLEAVDDFPETPTSSLLLSVQTLPADHEDDSMSPKTAQDYKNRRQQNRAALESHFLPQFLAPNFLDSIKEENSDMSDSERRSECSDRTDHSIPQCDLEDDVFLDAPKKANAVYPKSNLDFSKKHKHVLNVKPPKTSMIREEASPPSVVEAKIIDQGSVEESCSSWATDLTPQSEAAEVVYIDSASSSVSDLLELDYSQGQPDDPIDVRIQTPTIDLESVNDMFAACQQKENNDRLKTTTPSQTLPPVKEQENLSKENLLPPHNNNNHDRAHTLTTSEERKIFDEIISQKIETMSETIDTHADDDIVNGGNSSLGRHENSNENNSTSCDSAIDQVVTPSVVGFNKNMDNIREIVSASSASSSGSLPKSELHTITDQTDREISKPNFMIGQPCSDHSFKCETTFSSSSSSSSSTNTTTTTTTTESKILTLHELSKTLDDTKHLNPLVSLNSTLDRQESLDSHGSDQSHSTNQSQCTAINQGSLPQCDWNEFDTTTDTTYVSESDTAAGLASSENSSPFTIRGGTRSGDETESPTIRKLRSLCTEALASMPYGEEVLQELATVAQNIREMPYPLPDLPQIQDIQLSLGQQAEKSSVITLSQVPPKPIPGGQSQKFKSPPPPPVPEPPTKYDSWLGVPTESDPNVLVCLSPSQRSAVKNDSTADSLLDMHKKFVERRGYHEYTTKQVNAINQANSQEAQKLNKIDSPPPPALPPRPTTETSKPNGNTQAATDTNDDDQNNHRLLAIIRDTHESQQQHHQKSSMTSTSENISRRTENGTTNTNSTGGGHEKEFANLSSVSKQTQERLVSESNKSQSVHSEMQQNQNEHTIKVDREPTVMGMRFPTSEYFDSIFDGKNKRFSNIETGSPAGFCSQILTTQPKRYSNIETSSFESRKCVENGKVLYDVSDSKREKVCEGDQPDATTPAFTSFPDLSKTKTNGLSGFPFVATPKTSDSRPQTAGDGENIMSAFKLNTQPTAPPAVVNRLESSPPAPPVPPLPSTAATLTADTTATTKTATTKSTSTSESFINRNFNEEMREKLFDEFRQPAKEAAPDTNKQQTTTSATSATTKKSSEVAFQHEKLFKDFDELSNLLNNELESGKRRPPATLDGADIPSSVSDYNRVAKESRIQSSHVSSSTSTETNRREQMKKLADEIDRTTKQRREMRIPIKIERNNNTYAGPRSAPELPQQPRTYDIPVRVESGNDSQAPQRPTLQHQRSYEIPVQVETRSNRRQRTTSEHQARHEIPIHVERPEQPERFRRAESMFNISDTTSSRHLGHDDWLKYVGDLGSSENICKPFQREVEICYLGRRPNIRAPRMSASTNDLSNVQTFDTHGAYGVRRTTTTQTPRPQQPPRRSYLSTQSMIDTTPITPCVSSRRSPAPERRSSLPRELHDKQLQYITSKEQQLKYEFERLENERRQLIDEMNRTQLNQRISREAYRQRQLPPLTEDETFRQQMAEEWLDKVAEREERRLHKIIKISKINQETDAAPVAPPRRVSADDIGDEFLRRVKERRSKLCMPSDSDWESGAESQPQPRTDGSRSETDEPPATVFEGQSAANIKQLPKHLREFAKLTSQVKEERREETTENSSSSATKRSSIVTTVKTSNNNHQESQQTMQQDAARVRDLEQLSQQGKRNKLVTILRHKKSAESSGGASGGSGSCQPAGALGTTNSANSAIKRRKQTRFLLTPNRRSWSESDLLREIDKDLVLARGFLFANESIDMFAPKFKATAPSGSGVWTPKNQTPTSSRTNLNDFQPHNTTPSSPIPKEQKPSENRSSSAFGRPYQKGIPTPPPPPLWTPQPERKQFRPVHFESPTLQRRYVRQQSSPSEAPSPPWSYTKKQPFPGYQSQSCTNLNQKDTAISWPPSPATPSSDKEVRTTIFNDPTVVVEVNDNDYDDGDGGFAPTTSIAEKIKSFERSNSNYELRRPLVRHNPNEKPAILKPNEVIFSVKNEYLSEPETEYDKPKKMAQLSRRQYDGIGPTTKDGMPVVLRSEVKEPNQHEWYKRIFQTIHKQKNPDDYVTIRYKCPRGRYPYKSNGYMSEPEPPNYDSDYSTVKYRTLERRRLQSTGTGTESRTSVRTGNESQDETFYGTMPNPVKSGQGSYKVQPGRIENYITGHSSVSEKEKKEWWDEVMDIFNGWLKDNHPLPRIFIDFASEVEQFQLDQQKLSPHYTEGNLSRALLKEQGYTSDSNLVFRKKDVPILQSPLSPVEQKQVYKSVQAGGQPPLFGFRKPAPEKPKETEFEYLPITPTLTKIRVHSKEVMPKNHQPADRELICYPITSLSRPLDMFAPFPKHVPSFIPLNQAPLPPNRKSSRTRTTSMAMKISSSQVRRPTSANSSRHEACFQTKDAISPPPSKPVKYGTITLKKTVRRTEPLHRSKSAGAVVSILSAAKMEKSSRDERVSRKQQSVRLSSCSPIRSASRITTFRATSRSPVAFGRSVSKERSFAEEKKRIEESLPSVRTDFTASTNILRDPRLRSPDQVKRAVRSYAFPIERSKSAPKVLPALKPAMSSYVSTYVIRRLPSPLRKETSITKRSQSTTRSLVKSPAVARSKSQTTKLPDKLSSKSLTKTSSTVSLARTSSTFSVDSIASKPKPVQKKPLTITRSSSKTEAEKPKRKPITIASSKSDSNVLKKIKESPELKKKIIKAIPSQQKIVRTNHFFQNLFMRDNSPKRVAEPISSVHEKTRYWNTMLLPSKKSTSESRQTAYRSLSPPIRPHFVEEYESVQHFQSDDEGSEFGDRSGRTEDLVWQYEQRSRSEPRPVKTMRTVCDIARPESPARSYVREFSPTREIRVPQTREMRSPSRRRIQNFREIQRGETGKVIRASSLSSADDLFQRSLYHCDDISRSTNSLDYIERHSPSCRHSNSERFIDLNRFYSTLERVGQLERATSTSSLKPIRKEGEPLDFEEWRKIRFHERAERELSYLVGKLKDDQKQKDFLFRPKDVEDVKWVGNRDLSLKSKDKSVEDLRENFEKKIHQEWLDESKRQELESKKDTYKPYWRGSSVVDLASNMEIKYNPDSGSFGMQKMKSEVPQEKPLCLSNRLISTLSKDQVTKITQQLNEIYNASEPKAKPDITEEYVITVDKQTPANALKVRCNSSISKEELIGPVLRRKEASEKPAQSKKIDRLSREFQTELTESEKRRLSNDFSREIRGKPRSSSPVILGRETRGASAAENAKRFVPNIPPPPPLPKDLIEVKKSAPPKPKRKAVEELKQKEVEIPEERLTQKDQTSNEAEPENPDETVSKKIQYFEERRFEEPPKTIYHAREDSSPDEDELMRVIEANIKARAKSGQFYHQELSSSVTNLKDLFGERESSRINFPLPRLPPPPDETIYHETTQDQNRSTSLTLRGSRDGSLENIDAVYRSRSISPHSKESSYLHRVNTGEVRKIKDKFESLGRPKKKKHFFAISPLRKVRSDPELSNDGSKDTFKTIVRDHELGDVSWIAHKFEVRNTGSSGRGRSRVRKPGSPIQRMPLRKEDRLMPHIDIISKTASLKQEMMKSRSPSPVRQQATLHAGEVERIRCIFETSPDRTSPVGQPRLGTSSPELRDISSHLTASWIAHKYPKPLDNDLRSPPPIELEKHVKSDSLPSREIKHHERTFRSRSISPPKAKQKQPKTSILKPRFDFFANQKFDPLMHRPKARYVPDLGDDSPKKTIQSGTKKTTAVKFKDDDEVPTPPLPPTKGVPLDSYGSNILESPNRYFESDVNIHYKTPIRYEYKDPIPEEELAIRQAEQMQKLYQEERRRKYLQELQDMNSRRHTDNFTPSQKSPIPLNRYDDFNSDLAPKSPNTLNYPRTVARALYNFQGQTARELTFKKGDVIYIRRQIDKNWYEGEHNAMIGLLPSNYVELLAKDGIRQPPKKPSEGQARAKYNFQAQSGIELSLNKGEHVTLTRRVDDNWFEGKIANRKGIFPVSYVEVLVDIGAEDKAGGRIPASQSIITQSSSSMRPSLDTLRTNINNEFNSLTSNGQQPPNGILRETRTLHKTEVLHVDTNTEPVAYRALYKYRPQNTDELELQEGDIVFVLEKCDDGWFVGTSQRSGCFGTFPGNYVERV